jgi:rare lipoprotein A
MMLKRPEATNMNVRVLRRRLSQVCANVCSGVPLWICVGTSCVALAGMLCTLPTRTVQADAGVPRPAAAASPNVVVNATPVNATAPMSAPKAHLKLLRGIASWYGDQFDGRKTASGETFSMDEMTACHPTLPFGTEVRVVNLRNHKSVVVRITDRAALVKGRVIDLSYAAAEKLKMTQSGVARVSIEVLALGHPVTAE